MGRYYFHVRLGKQIIPDDVGVELPDLASVRDSISDVLHASGLNLSPDWVFNVADDTGRIVLVVPLADIPKTQ